MSGEAVHSEGAHSEAAYSEAAYSEAAYSEAEWRLLTRLPQWVAKAASAAQPDSARRTAAEAEAGLVVISYGRDSGNPFVERFAAHLVATAGSPEEREAATAIDFADVEAGITGVLERATTAAGVIDTKASPTDGSAYRRWLLTIADVVAKAARSGDVLGFGGELVTRAERTFNDRLAQALEG